MIQWMLAIWSLVLLPFLNPVCTSGSSWFTYYWSLAWRILSISLLASEMSAIVRYFEHSLALPFFGIGVKTDLFQSCGHCWVFQICWHTECSTLAAASFRIEIAQLEFLWNYATAQLHALHCGILKLPREHGFRSLSVQWWMYRIHTHLRANLFIFCLCHKEEYRLRQEPLCALFWRCPLAGA